MFSSCLIKNRIELYLLVGKTVHFVRKCRITYKNKKIYHNT